MVARNTIVRLIIAGLAAVAPTTALGQAPAFVRYWGGFGTGDGQFNEPTAVAVDASGYVYVVDSDNYRVQKFTAGGVYVTQWGSFGTGNGQFQGPSGIAVDGSGDVYVSDPGDPNNNPTNRIQKFTSTGDYLTQWGSTGSANGQFNEPLGIAVDGSGNVYVADYQNRRVQKFNSVGGYLAQWNTGASHKPSDVAVGPNGDFYTTDRDNNGVQHFTSTGSPLAPLGTPGQDFYVPIGVTVDALNFVYVVDTGNRRIAVYRGGAGELLLRWGGPSQFNLPFALAIGPNGEIYVADWGGNYVQQFAPIPTAARPATWGAVKAVYR